MAFLLILESLTPIERAVFLLRSVFEYEFKEIAEITGKTEVNIRQIFHRARQNVHSRRPRFSVPSEQGWAVAGRFQQACATGNIGDLLAVLSPEVTLVSDGGGKAAAALRPIYGSDRVSRFIFGVLKKYEAKEVATTAVELNGAPAFLFYADGELLNALVLETDGRSISSIYIVRNPEKLTSLRQMPADASKQNDPRFVN